MNSNTAIPDPSQLMVLAIDKVKVRKHFSLIQKMFDNKKAYSRRSFKQGGRDEQ